MKKKIFVHNTKIPNLNLSLDDFRMIAKIKGIEGQNLLKISINELAKKYERIEKIKKDFNKLRDRFFKPKIKEIFTE